MSGIIVNLLMISTLFASVGAQGCPNDWISFENSCYVFIDEYVSWTSAKVFCEILGGRLLEVESKEENDFVAAELNRLSGISSAWIGLTDLVREGQWVWNSNREAPEYTNWAPGMPDDSHAHENGEDCVQIWPDGTWNDLWCEEFPSGERYRPSPVCELQLGEVIG